MTTIQSEESTCALIVLFHGLSSSPLELNYIANILKKNGFRVETPALKGYGFGDQAGTWEEWLNEASNIVSNLQKQEVLQLSVGGISLGATLALGVASKLDGINAVLCLSTTLIYNGWASPWYRILTKFGIWLGLGQSFKYKERDPFGIKNIQIRAYIKKAMAQIHQWLQTASVDARMLLQVHDELVFEVKTAEVEVFSAKAKSIMENVVQLSVPLIVAAGVGANWDEAH